MRYLVATPVTGPLTADQLTGILQSFRSIHQFQIFDQFSVVYISPELSLQLERGAMETIVEYLETASFDCRRTQWLKNLTDRLVIRPKPEPEVLERMPPDADDADDQAEPPKFVARVRYNLKSGRRQEETVAVNRLGDLDWLLDTGPYDEDIRNIKIKLEFSREPT